MMHSARPLGQDTEVSRAVASDDMPPLPRWVGWSLTLWVALLAADRIDLAGGNAPIVLTPFYLLTPLVILGGWQARRRGVTGEARRNLDAYSTLVAALVAVAALSIVRSADVTTSLGRLALLIAMAVGTLLVAQLAVVTPSASAAISRGARLGLALAAVFGLLELFAFLQVLPDVWAVGPVNIRLDTAPYAGIVPRLSGLTSDANRAGLASLIHLALIRRHPAPTARRGWTSLAGVLILLTLSRSAVLAAAIAAAYVWARRGGRIAWASTALPMGLLLLTIASVGLMQPRWYQSTTRYLAPLAGRLTLDEGSAQDHLQLVERGVTAATRSVRGTLLGTGYGTSFLLLRDRFGANRYGNFHSLYLTLWVESGIVALAVMLVLLVHGMRRPTAWRGPLLGVLGFNFFYQSHVDPAFWLLLALAWLDPATEAARD